MSRYGTDRIVMMFRNTPKSMASLDRWLAECARKHRGQEETEDYVAGKVKAYVDRLYDTASARLDTPELQEFLRYPDADFDDVARELCVDYYTENVAGAPMAKGERINPMTYDEALNVLPPKRVPAELLRTHGCTEGFLMGEPAGTGPGGRSLYHAYGRDAKGNCYYLGLSPEAGASASRQAKPRASPPKQASRSLRTKPTASSKRKPRTNKPKSKSKGVRR